MSIRDILSYIGTLCFISSQAIVIIGFIMMTDWAFQSNFSPQDSLNSERDFVDKKVGMIDSLQMRRPVCSNAFLRSYFVREKGFPAAGKWTEHGCVKKNMSDPGRNKLTQRSGLINVTSRCARDELRNLTFRPQICRFLHDNLPEDYLTKCFLHRNLSRIVTMGDSNGRRYHDAIISIINQSEHVSCTTVKMEDNRNKDGFQMDIQYFKAAGVKSRMSTERRGCHSCGSVMRECINVRDNGRKGTLTIEHIPLLHFKDASLKIIDKINELARRTIYFPEFIFRYYLPHDPPDAIIIAAPFNHEKYHKSLFRITKDMGYFFDLLQKYLPSQTKVIVLPAFHEQEVLKDDTIYPPKGFKYGGFTANELIDRLNSALFQLLEPKLIDPYENYFGFFYLGPISEKVSLEWASDAMHMFNIWYEKTMSQLLQLLCYI